jgi:hypothetical protein
VSAHKRAHTQVRPGNSFLTSLSATWYEGLRYTPDIVEDDGQGDEEQNQSIKYFLQYVQGIPFPPGTSAGASAPSSRMRLA